MNTISKSLLRAFVLVLAGAGAANAQLRERRPFPFVENAGMLAPQANAIEELRGVSAMLLGPVRLPDGRSVHLDLRAVDLAGFGFGVSIDGVAAPELIGELGASLWSGKVEGDPSSSALLSFSRFGSRGWIAQSGETFHLLAEPGARGDWSRSLSRWWSGSDAGRLGLGPGSFCRSSELPRVAKKPRAERGSEGPDAITTTTLVCKVAIEGDNQLFARFNDVLAELSYVTSLLGAVSMRYEEQLDVVLTYPYLNLWTVSNDPWMSQDDGLDAYWVLKEFQFAWAGNVPAGGNLAHMLSGADLGGGIAYLDVICDPDYGFGVSGNLTFFGLTPFPVSQGPLNWDFLVIAHELGHNFSAIHTHEECPPLDECASLGYFGPCQTAQVCTNQGTLMSYCHLCPGWLGNVTTFFHAAQLAGMRAAADSACLVPCLGNDVYVDCGYTGPEDGSFAQPFNTIEEGIANVCSGGDVILKPGTCATAPIRFALPVTLTATGGSTTIQ